MARAGREYKLRCNSLLECGGPSGKECGDGDLL